MSKISEMSQTIEELRRCAAVISDAANWLAEQFSGDEAQEAPEPVGNHSISDFTASFSMLQKTWRSTILMATGSIIAEQIYDWRLGLRTAETERNSTAPPIRNTKG